MISVKLTGQFMKLAPGGSVKGAFTTAFVPNTSLSALLAQLGVDRENVKYSVLVNNSRKSGAYVLEDSDSVTVMPLLAGG